MPICLPCYKENNIEPRCYSCENRTSNRDTEGMPYREYPCDYCRKRYSMLQYELQYVCNNCNENNLKCKFNTKNSSRLIIRDVPVYVNNNANVNNSKNSSHSKDSYMCHLTKLVEELLYKYSVNDKKICHFTKLIEELNFNSNKNTHNNSNSNNQELINILTEKLNVLTVKNTVLDTTLSNLNEHIKSIDSKYMTNSNSNLILLLENQKEHIARLEEKIKKDKDIQENLNLQYKNQIAELTNKIEKLIK